jgi:hypothetical protein
MTLFANVAYLAANQTVAGPWVMAGTEMRNGLLVPALNPAQNMVLLGNGMWEEPSGGGPNGLGSGAQILAQYAPPSGPVVIEAQLPPCEVAIASMVQANFGPGVSKACAGTWNASGNATVWTRDNPTRAWVPTVVWSNTTGATAQVRSLCAYTDQVTGVSYVFAGTDDTNGVGGICRGAYSATAPGAIVWDSTPELAITNTNTGVTLPAQLGLRVMSFAQFTDALGNTALYATVGIQLFKRIDGANPSWELVWTHPVAPGEVSQAGLRGLTAIGKYLFVSVEGSAWSIVQIDPNNGFAATTQCTVENLEAALGPQFNVTYVIGPYNGIRPVTVGSSYYDLIGLTILVSQWPIGEEIYTVVPPTGTAVNLLGQARYLVKQGSSYALYAITPFPGGFPMVGVRDFVPCGANVTALGFDCWIATPPGQTAWAVWDTQANAVSGL